MLSSISVTVASTIMILISNVNTVGGGPYFDLGDTLLYDDARGGGAGGGECNDGDAFDGGAYVIHDAYVINKAYVIFFDFDPKSPK